MKLGVQTRVPYTHRMASVKEDSDPRFLLACPHCAHRMYKVKAGSVTLDRCPHCGGIWLDHKELEMGLAVDSKALKDLDVGGTTRGVGAHAIRCCPRDKALLVTIVDPKQSHIRYEKCTICGGMFLDAGELRDLSEFTLAERIRELLTR